MIIQIIILLALAVLVFRWPYLGILVILASLPIANTLPSIPDFNSATSFLGGVALAGFLFSSLVKKKINPNARLFIPFTLILGLLLLLWMTVTNISAAVFPDPDGRIWLFTYLQLWLLAWLAALLLTTPQKIHTLMWVFFLTAFVSALYASFEGVIGESVKTSLRADGLADGINSAARYFLIALMFTYFLFAREKKRLLRLFLFIGAAALLLGLFFTVSRTGLLLLASALGILVFQSQSNKKRVYTFAFISLTVGLVWTFADNIVHIAQGIFSSISLGTDTVGIRYGLWQAGLRMWVGHVVTGVGIGQFTNNLPTYGWDLLKPRYFFLGSHNMYIGLLAETGLVGLGLFLAMFEESLRALWRNLKSTNLDVAELSRNWIIILILVLLAGVTKQDQYDKLTWLAIGISIAISRMGK